MFKTKRKLNASYSLLHTILFQTVRVSVFGHA